MKWAIFIFALWAGSADAACRQALVLGLDVSGSVDATEYQLQRTGLATALLSPTVTEVLIRQYTAPVDIAVFEWSGPSHQFIILPWITIADYPTLVAATNKLRTTPRMAADPTTAIGSAMVFAGNLLASRNHCWKQTVDLSGDGQANTGPRPQDITSSDIPDTVTVNALAIGSADQFIRDERSANIKELSSYFREYVVRGPDAFVEVALGFEDYANAMERKLLRELLSIAVGAAQDNQTITPNLPISNMPRQRPLWIKPR